ncbi:MAG TPA: APC family permease [Steroidobacteraceae bacterium]
MSALNRDTGLNRVVGPAALAASMLSIVVGAGIFVVPAQLAQALGSLAPLAVVACAVGVGAVGVCMAEAGSRIPSSGGVYAFVDAAFGPCAGYVAGIMLLVSNVLACGAVSSALGDVAAASLPAGIRTEVHGAVAAGTIVVICGINIGGIERGMRLVSVSTLVKLIPLVAFIAIGGFAIHAGNFRAPVTIGGADVERALLLTLFAFQGFETSLSAGGEIRDPTRTIPRAVLLALSGVALLYILVQVVAQGILGPSLAHSTVPLADAMGTISPALRALLLLGAALSMFGWLTSDLVGSPRILFAFGRDGLLFRALGRLSARTHAPYPAIITYGAVSIVLASWGSFAELAAPAALALAALYIAVCCAAWQLARRGVARAGAPLGFRWVGAAASVGAVSMATMLFLAPRIELLKLLVLPAASLLVYLIQTRVLYRTARANPPPD